MSEVVHKFTKIMPRWQPRVKPIALEDATDEQREALQVTPVPLCMQHAMRS